MWNVSHAHQISSSLEKNAQDIAPTAHMRTENRILAQLVLNNAAIALIRILVLLARKDTISQMNSVLRLALKDNLQTVRLESVLVYVLQVHIVMRN